MAYVKGWRLAIAVGGGLMVSVLAAAHLGSQAGAYLEAATARPLLAAGQSATRPAEAVVHGAQTIASRSLGWGATQSETMTVSRTTAQSSPSWRLLICLGPARIEMGGERPLSVSLGQGACGASLVSVSLSQCEDRSSRSGAARPSAADFGLPI